MGGELYLEGILANRFIVKYYLAYKPGLEEVSELEVMQLFLLISPHPGSI